MTFHPSRYTLLPSATAYNSAPTRGWKHMSNLANDRQRCKGGSVVSSSIENLRVNPFSELLCLGRGDAAFAKEPHDRIFALFFRFRIVTVLLKRGKILP